MTDQNKQHILILDSLSLQSEQLVKLLKDCNYQVTHLQHPQEAYQFCLANAVDLVIFDPKLNDGFDFFQQLKGIHPTRHIPCVITTHESNSKKRIEYMTSNIDDFVIKPYYPEEVLARVNTIFQEFKSIIPVSQNSEQGFWGNLKEMNLIDLIQTMEIGNKSGIIYLNRGDKEGQVYIHQGKIVNATVEGHDSIERAFLHMLTWIDGTFFVSFQDVSKQNTAVDSNQALFSQGTKLIDQWRQVIGELPSLNTCLKVVSNESPAPISLQEKHMLSLFQEPRTILQAIDHCEYDDFDGLTLIKALLQKGLLIKKEKADSFYGDERWPVLKFNKTPVHNQYSHIFSIFMRGNGTDISQASSAITENKPNGANGFGRSRAGSIENHIQLTKAELLIIRQKLGK